MLNIPVVLGSVRQNQKSILAARFLENKLKALGAQTQIVDFRELPLPFVDSPLPPSDLKRNYPYENVSKWSSIADAANGFVFVAPEYNHGYSGVLKNALDWLYPEFEHKVVGLVGVSSGKISGARAIEQLRPIVENFSMFAIRETVMFGPVSEAFSEDGSLLDPKYEKSSDSFLKSLLWSTEVMASALAKTKTAAQ